MKKVEYLQFQWFVYLQTDPVVLNDIIGTDGDEYDVDVERKEKFGLLFDGKKYWFMMDDPLDVAFEIDEHNAELLVKNSRGFTGKIGGKAITKGTDFAALNKRPNASAERAPVSQVEKRTGATVTKEISYVQLPLTGRPKPKQVKISLRDLDKDFKLTFGTVHPPSSRMWDLVKEAEDYLGLKVKINANVVLVSESERVGTSLITRNNIRDNKQILLNLNPKELAMLDKGRRLSPEQVAAAITHELGHYIFHEVIKNSDKRKFLKEVAGLRFHKDQYDHGQGYPWNDEHFAMMAEHCVHGHSARRLNSTIGLDIVEKYFDNIFLRGDENSKLYPPKK